jgi:hypothetical protein
MPAVELTRLHTQIHLLLQHYAAAEDFVKKLADLYEFYADRTFTQSDAGRRDLTLPAYNVVPLVTHQLELELGKLCTENPLSSLDVIDALWKQEKREPRFLAAYLLGKIPAAYTDQIINRLHDWSTPHEDRELLKYAHNVSSQTLRQEVPQKWLAVIQTWLASENSQDQIFGLQSLLPFIEDTNFNDLPKVFDLIYMKLPHPQARILFALQAAIEALAKRTPKETAYLLKKAENQEHSNDLSRLIRRILPFFPEEQQNSLKNALSKSAAI